MGGVLTYGAMLLVNDRSQTVAVAMEMVGLNKQAFFFCACRSSCSSAFLIMSSGNTRILLACEIDLPRLNTVLPNNFSNTPIMLAFNDTPD